LPIADRLMPGFRVLVAVLLAAGAGFMLIEISGGLDPGPSAASAGDDRPITAIAALGRIEPESGLMNVSAATPDLLETLLVQRGDSVQKGQVLGFLQSYVEQVAQRDAIAAQLDEATSRLAAEEEVCQAQIENAEIKLRRVEELAPLKIVAQEQTVRGLRKGLLNDKDILDSDTTLMRSNVVARRTHDNQQTVVKQEKASLEEAEARLQELQDQLTVDRLAATSEIRIAKANLVRAKAEIPVASLREQLNLAKARVRNAEIRAPIAGRILNIIAHPGEQVGQIDGKPILTMGDTDRMRVVAEIYETDIRRVHLGASASVTSRALDQPITGRVIEIGNMIYKNDVLNVDPAAKTDARIVEVRIELDDPQRTSRLSNLTVDVLIAGGDDEGHPSTAPKIAGTSRQ
jgi:HlyD family secretion protein